jgi:hypothetical protein
MSLGYKKQNQALSQFSLSAYFVMLVLRGWFNGRTAVLAFEFNGFELAFFAESDPNKPLTYPSLANTFPPIRKSQAGKKDPPGLFSRGGIAPGGILSLKERKMLAFIAALTNETHLSEK